MEPSRERRGAAGVEPVGEILPVPARHFERRSRRETPPRAVARYPPPAVLAAKELERKKCSPPVLALSAPREILHPLPVLEERAHEREGAGLRLRFVPAGLSDAPQNCVEGDVALHLLGEAVFRRSRVHYSRSDFVKLERRRDARPLDGADLDAFAPDGLDFFAGENQLPEGELSPDGVAPHVENAPQKRGFVRREPVRVVSVLRPRVGEKGDLDALSLDGF